MLSTFIVYYGWEYIGQLMWIPTQSGREERNFQVVTEAQLYSSFLYIYVV